MKTLERIYRLLGSFGLAIAILLGMFVTTFVGTLEQVHRGLYEVQRDYFESIIAWHPVVAGDVAFELPLPGGGLLMGLLAVNLAVGGMIRMHKDRRRLGILVTHLGIALLLAAGFVKFASGEDGYLALVPGESSSEFRSHYEWEIAIREVDGRRELLIPDADLRALEVDPFGNPAEPDSFTGRLRRALTTGRLDGFAAQRFAHPDLPFELELSNFVANASVAPVGPMWQPTLPVVDGYSVVWRPKETEAELNSPAVEARALGPNGETLGASILAGVARAPWTFSSEGRTFLVDLRARRFSMPFELRLDEFHKEEHPRTDIPSVYRSDVTTVRPEGPSEQARIEMNRPLRDGGLVLFQASFGERPTAGGPVTFSQFAVVRNPADKWPEYACWVIAAGMLLAFGERLLGFMRAQSARRAAEVGR